MSWILDLADKDKQETLVLTPSTDTRTIGTKSTRTRREDVTTFGGDMELADAEGIIVTTVLDSDEKITHNDSVENFKIKPNWNSHV